MQHEALPGFAFEHLDALHVIGSAQRGRNQRLGLATGEDGGAVSAWQHANFDPDGADLVELPSIRTVAVLRDLLAENALPQRFEIMREPGRSFVIVFRQFGFQLVFEPLHQLVTFQLGMLAGVQRVCQFSANLLLKLVVILFVELRGSYLALLLAAAAGQVDDSGNNLLDLPMSKLNGFNHRLFGNFLGA